jgi:hypothetical protein
MGNPYPVQIETADGQVRLAGQADFTDPGNQPGGSQPALVAIGGVGSVVAGGAIAQIPLLPGADANHNQLNGSQGAWVYSASHLFPLFVQAPVFTIGTLTIDYAELDICNADGTERMAAGLDTPTALASGQLLNPIVLDDDNEATGAGSDLTLLIGGAIQTTAGGWFTVTYNISLTASADFA